MSGLLHEGLSNLAREIAATGFAALWDGRAAKPEELVAAPAHRARRAMAELADRGRAEVDPHGRVVGVHGLTLRPTRHGFVHAGRLHWTWCALDSIGIPAALAIDAEAHTTCPSCNEVLSIAIRGGDPEITDVALWLPSSTVRHLMVDFCAAANLYCGRGHLEAQIDTTRYPGDVLDLAAAATLGRTAWADIADHRITGQTGRC